MNRSIIMICFCLSCFIAAYSSAQDLTFEQHIPSRTDSLNVYKLTPFEMMIEEENHVWNFSNLPIDSARLISAYFFSPSTDTTDIGLHCENMNLYCNYKNDTLWLSGYESSQKQVQFTSFPLMTFPFAVGDSLVSIYKGEGKYCHLLPYGVNGRCITKADALGQLILPDMTVDSALRVHSIMHYHESLHKQTSIEEDHYLWYSLDNRYPLLETVKMQKVSPKDTSVVQYAYYYPQEPAIKNLPTRQEIVLENEQVEEDPHLLTNVSYLPNPVQTNLNVRYVLVRSAQVYISVHYNGGAAIYQTPLHHEEDGAHGVSIDMSGMPIGSYVIYIHADDTVVSGNIIKY